MSDDELGSEEEGAQCINYGNICLEDLKCTLSSQLKSIKKIVTHVSEQMYKSNHVRHGNIGRDTDEGGSNEEATDCEEEGYLLV